MTDTESEGQKGITSLTRVGPSGELIGAPEASSDLARFGIGLGVLTDLRRINDALARNFDSKSRGIRMILATDFEEPILFVERINRGAARKVIFEVDDNNCTVSIPGQIEDMMGLYSNSKMQDFLGLISGLSPVVLSRESISDAGSEEVVRDDILGTDNIDLMAGGYMLRQSGGQTLAIGVGVRLQPGFEGNLWSMYSFDFTGPREKLETVTAALVELLSYDPYSDPEVAIRPVVSE